MFYDTLSYWVCGPVWVNMDPIESRAPYHRLCRRSELIRDSCKKRLSAEVGQQQLHPSIQETRDIWWHHILAYPMILISTWAPRTLNLELIMFFFNSIYINSKGKTLAPSQTMEIQGAFMVQIPLWLLGCGRLWHARFYPPSTDFQVAVAVGCFQRLGIFWRSSSSFVAACFKMQKLEVEVVLLENGMRNSCFPLT